MLVERTSQEMLKNKAVASMLAAAVLYFILRYMVAQQPQEQSYLHHSPAATIESVTSPFEISYTAGSRPYNPVPRDLEIITVVVVTRHGDRAQITRSLGNSTAENGTITEFWSSALPVENTFRLMAAAAAHPKPFDAEKKNRDELNRLLCTGFDREHSPYAMLTELGATQLLAVGRALRQRYVGGLLPTTMDEAVDQLFCRSTNICRTTQSLRALLAGLYPRPVNSTDAPNRMTNTTTASSFPLSNESSSPGNEHVERGLKRVTGGGRNSSHGCRLPSIATRSKQRENIFPSADGPCPYFAERRVKLYHDLVNSTAMARWGTLEKRMKDVLGTSHRRIGWLSWLNILDVFTSLYAHNVPLPEGVTHQDLVAITDLVGWMWKVMYDDNMLARFAIGRFILEMVENMDASLNITSSHLPHAVHSHGHHTHHSSFNTPSSVHGSNDTSESSSINSTRDGHIHSGTKMLIYSGHDSTMVPLLGAVGLYNGDWPPYASYLTMEVGRLRRPTSDPSIDPRGQAGELYVRAVYNDQDRVMAGCGGRLWCKYDLFKSQALKTSWTSAQYQRECHAPKNGFTSASSSPAVASNLGSTPSTGSSHYGPTTSADKRQRRQLLFPSVDRGSQWL